VSNELIVRPSLTPDIWHMLSAVGQSVADSKAFGPQRAPEAAIKALFCYENGLPLTAANTGIFIVNGKLAVQSNIVAAQIRKHPTYDYRVDKCDDNGATVTILRQVDGAWRDEGTASFTKDEATKAGLANKDNWKGYPSDMLFARALSRAQRRYAPDIWGGPVYTPEELGAKVDDEGAVIEGTWTNVPTAQIAAAPSLNDLVAKYGAEKIMAANGGAIPGTDEELRKVADALETDIPI